MLRTKKDLVTALKQEIHEANVLARFIIKKGLGEEYAKWSKKYFKTSQNGTYIEVAKFTNKKVKFVWKKN